MEPPLPQSGQPGSEAPRPQNSDQEEVPAVGRSLSGTTRAEELVGGAGNDTIRGQAGDDRLNGAGGDDELWGNSGRDALQGGTGDDWLKGGDSSDTYVFGKHHGHDTIVEFRKGEMLVFETGLFRNASEAKAALYLTDDGVALATGDDSSILFTGTSLQQVQAANWILNG